MTDINEVRERLSLHLFFTEEGSTAEVMEEDLRALLADHARLQSDAERCRSASTRLGLYLAESIVKQNYDQVRISALLADSQRLNFIESEWFFADPARRARIATSPCWASGEHQTLRSAIDAAKAVQP